MNQLRVLLRHEIDGRPWPQPIYAGDPPEPIPAKWAEIVGVDDAGREVYALVLRGNGDELLEWLQYDTPEIAVDQAWAILGVRPEEWRAI